MKTSILIELKNILPYNNYIQLLFTIFHFGLCPSTHYFKHPIHMLKCYVIYILPIKNKKTKIIIIIFNYKNANINFN